MASSCSPPAPGRRPPHPVGSAAAAWRSHGAGSAAAGLSLRPALPPGARGAHLEGHPAHARCRPSGTGALPAPGTRPNSTTLLRPCSAEGRPPPPCALAPPPCPAVAAADREGRGGHGGVGDGRSGRGGAHHRLALRIPTSCSKRCTHCACHTHIHTHVHIHHHSTLTPPYPHFSHMHTSSRTHSKLCTHSTFHTH